MRTIDECDLTKEVAEKWLTKQVRAINKLQYTGYRVMNGDEEKYYLRNLSAYDKIHIFGIETLTRLAQFVDKSISIDANWSNDYSRYYFMYKGVEVFCLISKEGNK